MIKTNINEFIGRMQKRGTLSIKAERDTPQEAHSKFIIISKNRAPKDTGETIESIKGEMISNKHFKVVSLVSGSFKHNLWTNRTPPYAEPQMTWNNNEKTVYGDGSHNTTGIPMWWTKTAIDIANEYKSIALKYVSRSLNLR